MGFCYIRPSTPGSHMRNPASSPYIQHSALSLHPVTRIFSSSRRLHWELLKGGKVFL